MYNNLLIALEPYALPNTYLTSIENNLRFNSGTAVSNSKGRSTTYNIGLNQCFLITKSTVGTGGEDIPIFLESAYNMNNLITLNANYFNLAPKDNNKAILNTQSFYFEKSQVIDDEHSEKLISLRVIDPNKAMYLAFENKQAKAYAKSTQIEAQNNISFILHIIPFQIQIKLITLYDGSVKTISTILGVLENNTTGGTGFIIEPVNQNKNFVFYKDQFYMKNTKTNTYVVYDNSTFFLYEKAISTNSNCIFNLEMSNGFYTLINNKGQNLVIYQDNLLKFADADKVMSNENLFKIDLQYII